MSDLSLIEKAKLEKLFGMSSGYVMDFGNNTMQYFVAESIGIDIYTDRGYEEYCSKANKLRDIWRRESNYKAGKLTKDLLDKFELENPDMDGNSHLLGDSVVTNVRALFNDCTEIANRLLGDASTIEFPTPVDDNLSLLLSDIKTSLVNNTPELVLDRLHTFATKYLRDICDKYLLTTVNNSGDYLPLHSLMGKLKGYYFNENVIESEFTKEAIKVNISVIDKYNGVRNNESFAHDNIILNKIESKYAVKTIANILVLIDEIENMLNGSAADNEELPF